jgi:peptidoglycan hydrolase-like protein with peptidoglycan-binding domain
MNRRSFDGAAAATRHRSRERRQGRIALADRRGYDVGEPDGAIGAKANEAIADFQEKNGMPSTAAPRSRRWRR